MKPLIKTVPSDKQKVFDQDVRDILARHKEHLVPLEMLAVIAHTVGVLIALQDPDHVSAEQALDIVQFNMELGNREALKQLEPETEH